MNNELKKTTQEVFKAAAKEKGVDPQKFVDDLKENLRENQHDLRAISTLTDLVNLIVITHQEKTILMNNMYSIVSEFMEEPRDDNGNGRRYIKHFLQKPNQWEPNKFIPDSLDTPKFKVNFIKFKDDQGNLLPNSKQVRFDITYQQSQLITYFINGKLTEFIETQILEKIGDSVIVYLYDMVMKALINTNGKGKTINGQAGDLFTALTTELLPELRKMKQNSNKYNVDLNLTQAIDASNKEDLIMLVSPRVMTILESNVMSQLFNSSKLDIKDYVGKIYTTNNKFNFDGDTVSVDDEQYIDDNTIIVIDKRNFLKMLKMLEVSGDQKFPLNMSELRVLHLWTTFGYLDWGKVLTYRNNNLTVSPSNV